MTKRKGVKKNSLGGKESNKFSHYQENVSDDDIDAFQMQREKILLEGESEVSSVEDFDEAVMDLPNTDDDDNMEEKTERWGKTKNIFYSADVSIEDLQDEAIEARKLQKKQFEALGEEDFGLVKGNSKTGKAGPVTLELSDVSEEEIEEFEDKFATKEEVIGLDSNALGQFISETTIASLKDYTPEIRHFFEEFKSKLTEIQDSIEPILAKFKNNTSKGLSFLETKYQLLVGYCANLAYYLLLKVEGKSIENHPVVERLVKYRMLIEKIKPMETKLQYQIDKLLHAASGVGASNKLDEENLAMKPNMEMLMEGDTASEEEKDKIDKVYRAPKVALAHFEGKGKKDDRSIEKGKLLTSESRLLKDLQAEFEDKPEEEIIDQVYGCDNKLVHPKHRENYEEENFVRFALSKKEKRKLEKLQSKPIDELEDLNDFFKGTDNRKGIKESKTAVDRLLSMKLGQNDKNISGDNDVPAKRTKPSSKMIHRPEESSDMSEIEDDMDLNGEDDFHKVIKQKAPAKKNYQPTRSTHYRPIRDLGPDDPRPASYDMIKNKGLTPNRPRDVRNPRVRQRRKWEKAQKRITSFKAIKRDSRLAYSGESTGIRTDISRSVKF